MVSPETAGWEPPTSEDIESLMRLTPEEIARIVLCLLVEEALRERLAAFRPQHLPPQPGEGPEELVV